MSATLGVAGMTIRESDEENYITTSSPEASMAIGASAGGQAQA